MSTTTANGNDLSPGVRGWMDGNLSVQGYQLLASERRELWLGLRFSTGLCLALTIVAFVLSSAEAFLVLSAIGAVAGFSSRHPFDYIWNWHLRRFFKAPPLPVSPRRRRHAFKVAGAMMLSIAGLLALELNTAALVVGSMLIGACSAVTLTNYCVPSTVLAFAEGGRSRLTSRASGGAGV